MQAINNGTDMTTARLWCCWSMTVGWLACRRSLARRRSLALLTDSSALRKVFLYNSHTCCDRLLAAEETSSRLTSILVAVRWRMMAPVGARSPNHPESQLLGQAPRPPNGLRGVGRSSYMNAVGLCSLRQRRGSGAVQATIDQGSRGTVLQLARGSDRCASARGDCCSTSLRTLDHRS